MLSESELDALIKLLDDEDPLIYRQIHRELVTQGKELIPFLEAAWSDHTESPLHQRIELVIHDIQFQDLIHAFAEWKENRGKSLFEGALLISRVFYPELSIESESKKFQQLRKDIWLELNYNQTPLEQIQVFNQVFYGMKHFSGEPQSKENYDHCINHVLESRKGNAISLGILYQSLAADLGIPVHGVRLKGHYILAYLKQEPGMSFEHITERDILFYINPVNRGSVFSRQEIREYLRKMNMEAEPGFFLPCSTEEIIRELLSNLIEINAGKSSLLKDLNSLLRILDKEQD
jgi:regulator of sirC expression with transglutaminase-like and TPR domain